MPYAPVHLKSNGNSWGTNITLSWVRQTRLGGAWVDSFAGTVVAEDQEAYELELLDGPGGTVLRTATGITSASFVYTMVDGTCQYAADNSEFDEGEPERVVVVDGGYLDMNAPIARQRIAMGGVRLAGLLNRALGHQSA